MHTRTLGLIGVLCSPFLAIQLSLFGIFERSEPTSLAGVLGLIYMLGWFCSIVGLYKLNAAGHRKGKIVLIIQMVLLTIGNLWNIYSIINPQCNTLFFHITDLAGWPLDNMFMLVTGIAVVNAKRLQGWKRFVPLLAGLWLPVTLVFTHLVFGSSNTELIIVSLYSIVAWALLGLIVYLSAREKDKRWSLQQTQVLSVGN